MIEERLKGGDGPQTAPRQPPVVRAVLAWPVLWFIAETVPISKDLFKGLKDSHRVPHLIVHAISICCVDPGSKTEQATL